MKKIIALAIAGISISAHANYVHIDAPQCQASSKTAHGACVQNKTGKVIAGKLQMVEEIFYRDGGNAYGLYDITDLHADYYLDVAYTDKDFTKNNISSVVYAVDYNGTPIPGCIIQLTPQHPNGKSVISIEQKGPSDLVCVS